MQEKHHHPPPSNTTVSLFFKIPWLTVKSGKFMELHLAPFVHLNVFHSSFMKYYEIKLYVLHFCLSNLIKYIFHGFESITLAALSFGSYCDCLSHPGENEQNRTCSHRISAFHEWKVSNWHQRF